MQSELQPMIGVLQHAALEAQLADSAQEAARLRAQVTALESELVYSASAQHSAPAPAAASVSSAAHAARAAEVASLQAEVASMEQQISSLTARLQAASSAQSQVRLIHADDHHHCTCIKEGSGPS